MSLARWGLILVMLAGFVHGLFYVIVAPPWDLFDEGTHLAYALTMRDEQRIPRLDEYHRADIIESEIATERWEVFRVGRPDVSSPEAMGLGGRLYQGYQPPLYYALILPATIPRSDDPLATMYLARMFGPVLLAALAAVTWGLARAWFPVSGFLVPTGAALMVALVPAAGASAGRVNNDLLAATLVAAGVLAATRLHAIPTLGRGALVAALTVAAILTKSHGMLLLPVLGVITVDLWRTGRLSLGVGAIALIPAVLTAGLWALWTYLRYGVWTGTAAFLDFARPFEPLSAVEFVRAIWFHAWSSYWSEYGGGWFEVLTGLLLAILIVVGIAGLILRHRPRLALFLTAVLVGGLIAGLWTGNQAGFVYPQGRVLLPVFPAVAVLVAGGWSQLLRQRAALVPVVAIAGASVLYVLGWYLPFFVW